MGQQYGSCCWFPSEINNSKLSKIQSCSWLISPVYVYVSYVKVFGYSTQHLRGMIWIPRIPVASLIKWTSTHLTNNLREVFHIRATIRNDFSNSIVFVSTFKIAFFWHFPPLVCSWFLWLVWRIKLLLYRRKRKLRKYVIKNLHEWKDDATNHLWLA